MSKESRAGVDTLVCPRCKTSTITRDDAPDGSEAWFISTCEHCCLSWRSTEEVTHVLEAESPLL
jgi:hypothetical protein